MLRLVKVLGIGVLYNSNMLKTKKNCNVCKLIKQNPPLLNRIYNSAFFMKTGESLASIAKDYSDFKYDNLLNHVKRHQFIDKEDFNKRHLSKIAKEAEKTLLKHTIESKQVWDTVIDKGMEKLEKGEITMRTGDLLKAAKDKSDYEFKVKDQQMAMMEMVYHFASGESTESRDYDRRIIKGQAVTHYDPADESAEDSGTGEDRPGDIYYPPAWDAPAPGTS